MSTDLSRHSCNLPWCDFGDTNELDHWQNTTYIPGRLSLVRIDSPGTGASLPAVRIGAMTVDGAPAVYLHIDGSGHDAQADLTLADAKRLRDRLDAAIHNASSIAAGETVNTA